MIMFGHRYRTVIHLEVILNFQTVRFVQRRFNIRFFFFLQLKKKKQPLFRYVYIDILFYHHEWSVHAKGQQADHVRHTATQMSYMHFCAGI